MVEKGGALSLSVPNVPHEKSLSGGSELDWSWFAVLTKPRHEKKVNSGLNERGIHNFLPLHLERRRWSDRHQWVELPLFSQYLFVRTPISAESRARVLQTPGVVQFIGTKTRGTPIPEEQIDSLQAIAAQGIPLMPHQFLRVGERVRIRGGALEGIEGILSAVRKDRSLVVSVDLIEKSVAIRIDGFEVEPV